MAAGVPFSTPSAVTVGSSLVELITIDVSDASSISVEVENAGGTNPFTQLEVQIQTHASGIFHVLLATAAEWGETADLKEPLVFCGENIRTLAANAKRAFQLDTFSLYRVKIMAASTAGTTAHVRGSAR